MRVEVKTEMQISEHLECFSKRGYPYSIVDSIYINTVGIYNDELDDLDGLDYLNEYGDLRKSEYSKEELIILLEDLISHRCWDVERRLNILKLHFSDGLSLTEVSDRIGLSRCRVREILNSVLMYIRSNLKIFFKTPETEIEDEPVVEPITLQSEVSALELSVRACNCLFRGGLRTIGDVCNNQDKLTQCPNLGTKTMKEIIRVFEEKGYPLNSDIIFTKK